MIFNSCMSAGRICDPIIVKQTSISRIFAKFSRVFAQFSHSFSTKTLPKRVSNDSQSKKKIDTKIFFLKIFAIFFRGKKSVFWYFRTFFKELRKNGGHQQLPWHFWLQINLFGARYDPWSSFWHGVPSWDGLREHHWPAPGRHVGNYPGGGVGHLPNNIKW